MVERDFLAAACGHPARLKALVVCESRPASITELALIAGLQRQAMEYHVKRLEDAKLLEAVDHRKRRGVNEALYRATPSGPAGSDSQWRNLELRVLRIQQAVIGR